jgi:hypothetical protein
VLVGLLQRAAVFEPRYGDEVRRRLRLPAARARQMRERFEGIRALFEVCVCLVVRLASAAYACTHVWVNLCACITCMHACMYLCICVGMYI